MVGFLKNVEVKPYIFDQVKLRLVILSDTHGYLDENIAALIRTADVAIHAGDVMDISVLEQMHPALKTIAVAGNNDEQGLWSSRDNCFTKQLPASVQVQLSGGTIAIEHGHRFGFSQPDHQSLIAAYPEARAIIYGHTHKQLIDQSCTPWVLNPGAAGLVRNQGGPRCLVLNTNGNEWLIEASIFPQPYFEAGSKWH
ncbi:MAG: putative phosphoesterase [Gammaproteobacteria bacterium]|jgi:putative phosphoesterase